MQSNQTIMLAALLGNLVCIVSVFGGAVTPSSIRPTEIFEPPTRGNSMTPQWLLQHVLPVTGGLYTKTITSSGHLPHQIMATVIATTLPMVAAVVMVLYSTYLSSRGGLSDSIKITSVHRTVTVYQQLQDILKSLALSGKLKASFRLLLLVVLKHCHSY